MIFKFWKKQNELATKKLLIRKLIREIDFPESDKKLFLWAIWIVPDDKVEKVYNDLVWFIEDYELKQIDEIEKENFVSIDWMTYKEANQKKTKINGFNFLLTNI